jgi:hypothetical protein
MCFEDEQAIPRPGLKGKITAAELVALSVAQATMRGALGSQDCH